MMEHPPLPELKGYVFDGLQALGFDALDVPGPGDVEDALAILLANLRHVCDAYGLDYAETDRPAYEAYLRERMEAATAAAGDDADDQAPIV